MRKDPLVLVFLGGFLLGMLNKAWVVLWSGGVVWAVSRTVSVRVPPWLSVEEARRLIEEFVARLGGRVSVGDVRRELGVRPEDLVEDLEVFDVEGLEVREKERLR